MTNAHMTHSGEGLQSQEAKLQNPFPNKYHFDEFAGFEGERRLKSVLRKILPIALYRTWEIFDLAQAPGNDCYLGLVKASEAAERVQKTIRQDLLEFEARTLLVIRPQEKLLRRPDGTYQRRRVIVKDFSGLYRLAHEYYCWTQSEDYIEPDRDFVDLIRLDEYLVKKLRRFNNYRRILQNQIPGPKAQEREEHRWFTEFEEDQNHSQQNVEDARDDTTDPIRTKQFPKELPEQFPKHSVNRIESNDQVEPSSGDSNSSGFAETAKGTVLPFPPQACSHVAHGTIRNENETEDSLPIESHRISNRVPSSEEMSAGAEQVKEVKDDTVVQNTGKGTENVAPSAPLSRPIADLAEVRTLPVYLEGNYLTPLSMEFRDKAPRSSVTRLAKSYWRMNAAYGVDEFAFVQLLTRPVAKTRNKLHSGPVPNPMAFFFTVLENDITALCNAWDEELHRKALEEVQQNTPAPQPSSREPETFNPPTPVQGMVSQEEAEALLERIQCEIIAIPDLRLWDGAVRAYQKRYVVDLDLEYSPEPDIVHRWEETFATVAEWAAYYAEQTRGRRQS